ncbi:MAG: GntR family transcriptional regulator [Proteobacteria bacterium]|nr:GntR family transcriptional regulator [Pseudomonadota bacterium]
MPEPRNGDLARKMAHEILVMFQSGEIQPGDHLRSQLLADRFGVSRSPVRGALHHLSDKGVLEQRKNRGFFAADKEPGRIARLVQASSRTLEDQDVYRRIAEDWLTDAIEEDVTELQLQSRYDLTKAELKDILLRATREGWAERKKGYGWRFLPVAKTPEAFEQIYRFRMTIEPAAILEPTFTADRKRLTKLRDAQQRLLDTDIEKLPVERLLDTGSDFHESLIQLSGNPFFHLALVQANRMRRLLEYRARLDHERVYSQCQQHIEIIDLLASGELIEASYRLKRHLSGALARKSPAPHPAIVDF